MSGGRKEIHYRKAKLQALRVKNRVCILGTEQSSQRGEDEGLMNKMKREMRDGKNRFS